MYNKTDKLIDYLLELKNSSLSDDIHQVKRCLLDYLGLLSLTARKLLDQKVNNANFSILNQIL